MEYIIEYKNVKNITLRIKQDMNVYVSVPKNLPKEHLEQFLESKRSWIDKKVEQIKKSIENIQVKIEDNGKIAFLGNLIPLKISSGKNKYIFKDNILNLYVEENNEQNVLKVLYKFYYDMAQKVFKKILDDYLIKMNESISTFKINKSKTRWGYCIPQKKVIFLNVELIKRSIMEIEYVIIHEIAHLKVPNHSKDFYYHVEKFFKNYKEAEKRLKIRIDK